ncbi:unknown [Bacteroides sp. CAG:443]|nr:unknown [Bacteroides sp. CAG:443]
MRHLVLSWSYLLHHKQCQAHEAKTVAEVLQYDTTANKQSVFWLERCKQRIYYKG